MGHIDEISRFEEMLANEGVQLLKFLFLLPKDRHLQGNR